MKIRFRVRKFEKMVIALLVALVLICAQSLTGQAIAYKNATEAMQTAQNNRQYLFLLCYDKKSESLKAMESTVNDFRSKTAEKTLFYKAITTNEKEKDTLAIG